MKTKLLAGVLSAALLLSLAACSSAPASSTAATPAPEATSAPEATAAPETDAPTPTPAPEGEAGDPTPTPAPEGEAAHSAVLPAPETGTAAFAEAFIANPIDAKYAADLETAGSVAQMVAACNTAAESWQEQIDSVYTQLLDRADAAVVEKTKEEQSHWVNEQSAALEAIRSDVDEEDSMAALTVAKNLMLYYRERAIALSAALYEVDGALAFG